MHRFRTARPTTYLLLLLAITLAACVSTPAETGQPPTALGGQPAASTPATSTTAPTQTPRPTSLPTPQPTATSTPAPTATRPPDHTVCASGCDFDTIQAAIDAASTAPGDIILLSDPIHTEAGILIAKSLTLRGLGVEATILQAGESAEEADDRVLRIAPGAKVTIEAMTIRHGHPSECPMSGGGIMNEGSLILQDCSVRDNIASAGGGLMSNGSLTIIRCSIRDNVADGHGGENGMGRGSGGGIKNMVGPLTLIDSTVSGNSSTRNGGGLKISCSGTLDLINSTVSSNQAKDNGGGLEVRGVVTMTHSTIAGNQVGRRGGGVYLRGTSDHVRGILNYANTLFAGNQSEDCMLGDNATIGLNAHNLVQDGTCSPAYSGDPQLDLLADNGGSTQTHALLPGSPAIDAIPATECPVAADQRGVARPVALTDPDSPCDAGAYEARSVEDEAPQSADSSPPVPTSSGKYQSPGDYVEDIKVDDVERWFTVHLPPGYEPGSPLPLVVNLHPYSGNMFQQEELTRMNAKADEEGFIVVHPQALHNPPSWWGPLPDRPGEPDRNFFRALLAYLQWEISIDPDHIYATGMSNGGTMTYRLGCDMADTFAAIAPVAGGHVAHDLCQPEQPISVLVIHGTDDQVIPYAGNNVDSPPVRTWLLAWARHSGCDPTPAVSRPYQDVKQETWGNCANGVEVTLLTLEGGGHTWPGVSPGATSGASFASMDATDVVWQFFEAHPRSSEP